MLQLLENRQCLREACMYFQSSFNGIKASCSWAAMSIWNIASISSLTVWGSVFNLVTFSGVRDDGIFNRVLQHYIYQCTKLEMRRSQSHPLKAMYHERVLGVGGRISCLLFSNYGAVYSWIWMIIFCLDHSRLKHIWIQRSANKTRWAKEQRQQFICLWNRNFNGKALDPCNWKVCKIKLTFLSPNHWFIKNCVCFI